MMITSIYALISIGFILGWVVGTLTMLWVAAKVIETNSIKKATDKALDDIKEGCLCEYYWDRSINKITSHVCDKCNPNLLYPHIVKGFDEKV